MFQTALIVISFESKLDHHESSIIIIATPHPLPPPELYSPEQNHKAKFHFLVTEHPPVEYRIIGGGEC